MQRFLHVWIGDLLRIGDLYVPSGIARQIRYPVALND